MQQDSAGLALTTDSAEAADALDAAVGSYLGWRTDAMQHLDRASAADPDFALPHAVRGILTLGLRKPELRPAAVQLLAAAERARPPASEREQRYLKALRAVLAGRITEAATHYEAIALAHPHDMLAIRLAQLELFWIGEVAWMRDITERAAPGWSERDDRYGIFLATRAFGLEENGAYADAERCGRRSVEINPSDPWGAHAVAHVLIMQARLRDGIDWCQGLSDNWAAANHIRHHNWWHLALFHIEAGDYDAALAVYDERLRDLNLPLLKSIPDFYVDIQNDVALLQRLELRGIDVGDRWRDLGGLAAGRIGNNAHPFTSAHCALALVAAGRFGEAAELVAAMHDFVAQDRGTLGPRYALAAIPAAEAAIAHRKGDHERVVEVLMPARRNLWQMGGSHAQRDLFFQLLADSLYRVGHGDSLKLLFAEMQSFGLEHLEERSSYADALASLH
jgi:tetratricopeptide (TPR) repeat protein